MDFFIFLGEHREVVWIFFLFLGAAASKIVYVRVENHGLFGEIVWNFVFCSEVACEVVWNFFFIPGGRGKFREVVLPQGTVKLYRFFFCWRTWTQIFFFFFTGGHGEAP